MKHILLIFHFLTLSFFAFGQSDTIRVDEVKDLEAGFKRSPIGLYQKVQQLSKADDSINAGNYLLKVDPLYLLWEWGNSSRPDTFLAKLNITANVRDVYKDKYNTVLASKKSEAYSNFEKMAKEDQSIRKSVERCGDLKTCKSLNRKMRSIDSAHFEYLHSYVEKNGWPKLEEGSMYATLLAIHDHGRHNYYMPYLKKGVKDGVVHISALQLIDHFLTAGWMARQTREILADTNAINYDISEAFNDRLPSSLSRIQSMIRKLCPNDFKYYYILEIPNEDSFYEYKTRLFSTLILHRLQENLQADCPKKFFAPEVWEIRNSLSNITRLSMILIPKQ